MLKTLLYLQFETYCDCLLDLGFISPESHDKLLSINFKEVLNYDDSINHEHESAGHRADGHTESQTSDNADQVCCEQETGEDRSDGERS